MPTIRTSEFTVLQIVGLDAAVVCVDIATSYGYQLKHVCQASQLFQNVLLLVLCVFPLRHNDPDASELEGMSVHISTTHHASHSVPAQQRLGPR
jgi:hypothetical protein